MLLRRLVPFLTAVAVVVALPPAGEASAAVEVAPAPALAVSAAVEGRSAEVPGPWLPAGWQATLRVTITNSGAGPLGGLAVSAGSLGPLVCSRVNLAPGTSALCTTQFEVAPGLRVSAITASATPPGGTTERIAVPFGYRGRAWTVSLDVEALIDGAAAASPGPVLDAGTEVDVVYRVRNTGRVPLGSLWVYDSGRRPVTCPVRALDPGDTVDCTAVITVAEGPYDERVVAAARDPLGEPARAVASFGYRGVVPVPEADFTVTALAGGAPAGAPPGPRVAADRPLVWGVEVANTGEDDLWGLYVWDRDLGELACAERHLGPGERTRCHAAGEAVPGPMTGTVDATAWATDGRRIERSAARHAFGFRLGADVLLETYIDGFDADQHAGPRRVAGSALEFTYVVHNTGTVPLAGVVVRDDRFGKVLCPGKQLGVGEAMTCRREAVARLGWWETAGTVRARSGGRVVHSTDKTFWHVRPIARVSRLDVTASIDGLPAGTAPGPALPAGSRARVVLRAVNTGNSPLWSVELRHPSIRPEDLTCSGGPDLQVGEAMTCRARLTVAEGQRTAVVEAVGWNSDGTRIVGEAELHYVGVAGLT